MTEIREIHKTFIVKDPDTNMFVQVDINKDTNEVQIVTHRKNPNFFFTSSKSKSHARWHIVTNLLCEAVKLINKELNDPPKPF